MVVRVVKAVDHGRARHGVVLIADVLGERHRKDLARVVRVLRDGEVVVARVQLVAAEAVFVGVVIVIRGEIIRVDLDGVYNAKKAEQVNTTYSAFLIRNIHIFSDNFSRLLPRTLCHNPCTKRQKNSENYL